VRLCSDDSLRRSLVARGREYAERHLDPPTIGHAYVEAARAAAATGAAATG
jgi:hypothetical protein